MAPRFRFPASVSLKQIAAASGMYPVEVENALNKARAGSPGSLAISEVSGLQAALDAKAAIDHAHTRLRVAYRAIAGADALDDTDCIADCDGTFTLDLPAASGRAGQVFIIRNSGAGTITIDPAGAEQINGAATYDVLATTATRIVSTGTGWIII